MSTSVERKPTPGQPHASELRPEAPQAVETLHETIKSWAPESECNLTENAGRALSRPFWIRAGVVT
ncbi:hypothetical protein GWP57_15300 [Gammaproteobacteria bacterium]|jgi:hypothetical protein|nr:hypothetical protein [Gammaproteobacteria bacterium]